MRTINIDCTGSLEEHANHYSDSLQGLQRVTIEKGCSLRVGDYIGTNFLPPSNPDPLHIELGNYDELLTILNVDTSLLEASYSHIQETIGKQRHLLASAQLSLQHVKHLLNSPLHAAASSYTPYILMGFASICVIGIILLLIYCCIKRGLCRRRRPEEGNRRDVLGVELRRILTQD